MSWYWSVGVPIAVFIVVSGIYAGLIVATARGCDEDVAEAKAVYDRYAIADNHVCRRYLNRVRTLHRVRYALAVASITALVTYLVQFTLGSFSPCTPSSIAAQVAISVAMFVGVFVTHYNCMERYIRSFVCGRGVCSPTDTDK